MRATALTVDEFLDSRTEWDSALQHSLDNHIFLTWEWLSCWWKHFGDHRDFMVVTINNGKRILAAAPMMATEHNLFPLKLKKIEFIGAPASDYHSLLLTVNRPELVRAMIECLDHLSPDWDCLEFGEVPTDSATANALRILPQEQSARRERICTLCPYVMLPETFDDYFRGLGSNWRRNMRRWGRNLKQDFQVEFKVCNDPETLDDDLRAFFRLHQQRWQSERQLGAFADKTFRDFHLEVAKIFAQRGWLNLCFLVLNGEPVSVVYAFKYARKMFNYLSGFDPQYSDYRVGHLVFLFHIEHSLNNGIDEFDFMRGNESYKKLWNTATRQNLELIVLKRAFVPLFYSWITGLQTRARMKERDRSSGLMQACVQKIGRPLLDRLRR